MRYIIVLFWILLLKYARKNDNVRITIPMIKIVYQFEVKPINHNVLFHIIMLLSNAFKPEEDIRMVLVGIKRVAGVLF